MRKSFFFALIVAACIELFAAENINVEGIRRGTVFIYASKADGSVDPNQPLGTGFIVGVPQKNNPRMYAAFLVTARHIVEPRWAFCGQANPSKIFIRVNKSRFDPEKDSNGFVYFEMPLMSGDQKQFVVHDDLKVDAAVVPLRLPPGTNTDDYELQPIPLWVFATDDELKNMTIGDKVVSAGLLPPIAGVKRNYAVFKFGHVSVKPNEYIETQCSPTSVPKPEKAWFIAINLVPGNSGSPVFKYPEGANGISLGEGRFFLAGVQSSSISGADIAAMTPIQYVYEMILKFSLKEYDLTRGTLQPPNK